jgi:ABC-type multidrug transport system fused ATPase/permease subunit
MTNPTTLYTERLQRLEAARDQLDQRSRRIGNLNLLLFVVAFAVLALAAFRSEVLLVVLALLISGVFVGGLIALNRTNHLLQTTLTRITLNQRGLARIRREWRSLPVYDATGDPAVADDGASLQQIDAATAADLDLIGHASLEQLLSTPNTPVGKATLRRWILNPAPPTIIHERQQSCAELAPQVAFREDVALSGLLLEAGNQEERYARFMAWAEGEGWLHHNRHWLWAARLLPLLVVVLFALLIAGQPVLTPFLLVLLVNLTLLQSVGRTVNHEISCVAAQQGIFAAYAEIFELLDTHSTETPGLRQLQARLGAGSQRADRQMRRLARLMPFVDIRRSIYFFPIDVASLWSFHVLWLLERWQQNAGAHVREWLVALGEAEALMALATLHFEEPTWVFPSVEVGQTQLTADQLAHPLLPSARAVGNDVQIGPPDSYLLVTGSNMSGKSTLLRAIGLNIVLAQMGAPVCARRLTLPPLAMISSMRVQDSLEAGVSFYMAELRRLKEIVDRAERQAAQDGPLLLYLLDEILQGTNTAERQIAARHIIRALIDHGAIGAVSTHDLTLAAAPDLQSAAQAVYFTEHFTRTSDGPTMTFDYKLRPGIAISTNALKLMELVGLPVTHEDALARTTLDDATTALE